MIQATLYGNLGPKIEMKKWNDLEYLSFSVAVNKGKDKNPDWVNCTVWQKDVVTRLNGNINTGDKVLCQGSIILDEYTLRNGQTKSGLKMKVASVNILKRKQQQEGQTAPQARAPERPQANTQKYY